MKKIALLSIAAAFLFASLPASARLSVNLGFYAPAPAQPTYIEEPAPAYVIAPSYPRYYAHRHYYHRPVVVAHQRHWEHR